MSTAETTTAAPRRRGRRIVAAILVVLASLFLTLATVGGWARRTVTDTERYVSIVGPLIKEPAIQDALAARITDAVFEAIDLQSVLVDVLPEQLRLIAAPITSAVEDFVHDKTVDLLNSDVAERLWVTLNEVAHDEIVAVLHEETTVVTVQDGTATLNLLPMINAAIQAAQDEASGLLGRDVDLPSAEEIAALAPEEARAAVEQALGVTLPEDFGSIVIFQSEALASAQRTIGFAEQFVVGLGILTILLIVAAVVVSVDRRRTVAQLGLGAFLGLLIVRRAALRLDDDVVSLIPARSSEAAQNVVDAFLGNLRDFTTPFFVIAALVAIGAFLWGKREWISTQGRAIAAAAPGKVRPEWVSWAAAHADAIRIGGAAVALAILFMLDLTWFNVILLAVLVALAELALRRMERAAIADEPALTE